MTRRPAAVAGVLVAVALVVTTILVSPAGADEVAPELVEASPAAGEVRTTAPTELLLAFDRRVRAGTATVTLVGPGGDPAPLAVEGADGRTLRATPADGLVPGRHLVGWTVTAVDGAAEATGAFVWTLDPSGVGTVSVERAADAGSGRDVAWWAALSALVAVALVAAGLAQSAVAGRRLAGPVVAGALAIAVVTGLVALGSAGIDADGAVGDLVGTGAWSEAVEAAAGRWWAAALLVLALVPSALLLDAASGAGRLARGALAGLLVLVAVGGAVAAHEARSDGGETAALAAATVGDVDLSLEAIPGGAGVNEVHLYAFGPGGAPADLAADGLGFTHEATGIGPLVVPVVTVGPGHLIAATVDLPLPGPWTVSVASGDAAVADDAASGDAAVADPAATLSVEVRP